VSSLKSSKIKSHQVLLDPALVPALDEILASLVLCQKFELFGINGPSTLLTNHLHSILVLHPQLDECSGHQDRSSAQSSDTVDPNAGVRIGLELLVHQVEPLVHDLLGGGGAVREAQLGDGDLLLLQLLSIVEFVRGADEVGHLVLLQQPDVVVHGAILWLVGDEEAHIPAHVPVLDLCWRRSNYLAGHFQALLMYFISAEERKFCPLKSTGRTREIK